MLTAVVVVVVVNLLARSFVIAAVAAAVVLDQSVQSGLQNTHTVASRLNMTANCCSVQFSLVFSGKSAPEQKQNQQFNLQ